VARFVTDTAERQLADARQLLAAVRDALVRFNASPQDLAALAASIRQLDEFFLLVVVGEFNAGKSAFINALVGEAVLPEGVTPTTARIHLLEYGEVAMQRTSDGVVVVAAPAETLRDMHIVDTPGTNAVIREHERLTAEFVPRSDLVLFVTSADRPFTESERAFLEMIRDWGKKIAVIVNKIDILTRERDVEEVVAFVRDHARRLLGVDPVVFPVSARLAQRAKHGEPSAWAASRFEPLERYLRETLDEASRFRLKLANPMSVGNVLARRYAKIAGERLTLLQGDVALLDDIERQLAQYQTDVAHGFAARMAAVEKVLVEMENRGHQFFEDTMRLGRVVDLLNRARVEKEFEDRVVADAPRDIERRVSELIEWLIDQDFREWQMVTTRLAERDRERESRPIGAPEIGSFHADRARLMDSVAREAERVVEGYDRKREAETIADQARTAVAAAAAAGGAAVGLGTLVTVAASTVAADVTGILLAGVLATIGFLVIPARRRRAKTELQEKISALRERLTTALGAEFERSRVQSANRIANAVAPYTRRVRAEEERWEQAQKELTALAERASEFTAHIPQPTLG
jgi:small GTP-binding protein